MAGMKYVFLLYDVDEDWEPTPEALAPWGEFDEASAKIARQVAGEALQSGHTAKVVCVRDSQTIVTDGPFIESKEQLGGFYVFDCESDAVAMRLAEMMPIAHVEVRRAVEFSAEAAK
jgi:hypothetical protein